MLATSVARNFLFCSDVGRRGPRRDPARVRSAGADGNRGTSYMYNTTGLRLQLRWRQPGAEYPSIAEPRLLARREGVAREATGIPLPATHPSQPQLVSAALPALFVEVCDLRAVGSGVSRADVIRGELHVYSVCSRDYHFHPAPQ